MNQKSSLRKIPQSVSQALTANIQVLQRVAYDPQKDFKAIARTGDLPFMLVVDAKIPVKSVKN